jgi:glutamate-1-semialdehyde 2,1-aminomutase
MEFLRFPDPGTKTAKVGHPGTFNANPLSAAAGVACLREIADGRHQRRANDLAAQLRAGMNGVMCELGLPGFVYGQASEFRVVIAGTQVPEAQDYDPRDLPWALLEEGMPAERARLLHLAMTNYGAHLFGAGGLVAPFTPRQTSRAPSEPGERRCAKCATKARHRPVVVVFRQMSPERD